MKKEQQQQQQFFQAKYTRVLLVSITREVHSRFWKKKKIAILDFSNEFLQN